jgi:HlyD family secretion protein
MVVPRRLVISLGDQAAVWVVDQSRGRAELRPLELASGEKDRTGESVEVVGGLNPTDKLVASGLEAMRPGMRVRIAGEDR